jgi:hypothetical protein
VQVVGWPPTGRRGEAPDQGLRLPTLRCGSSAAARPRWTPRMRSSRNTPAVR